MRVLAPIDDRSEVDAAAARLEAAGRELRERTPGDVLDALAAWLDGWCAPDSPWQDRLARDLASTAGFHEATVREGLACGLGAWSGAALRDLVAAELSTDGRMVVTGFDLTAVVLAGSIPMPSLLSVALPLVLRSPVLVKCAARDPVTAQHAAVSLAEIDPLLGRCIEALRFDRQNEDCLDAFVTRAGCVVATGSDEAVSALAARVRPPRRFIGNGHRLSLAVIGPEADVERAARDLARDVALWDQLGCLSPVAVYCLGSDSEKQSLELSAALVAELADAEMRWPRGEVSVAAASVAANERSGAEMRAAAGADVRVFGRPFDRFCVIREADATARPAPLHRFVRVHSTADERVLVDALRPLGPHLAGVALTGMGPRSGPLATRLAARLGELGASRICAPGKLQTPPLAWHHDGRPLLLPLARLTDLEISA